MSRIFSVLMLVLLSCLLSVPAQATTKAGTRIINQAEASYFDTESGKVINVLSNYATLVVGRYLGLEQTQDNTQPAISGEPVYFSHTISNTGNVADTYTLSAVNLLNDNGDLENLKIYLDLNGDGLVNPGEPEISRTELLQPGASINVVVVGTVPSSAMIGDQYSIQLISTSVQDSSVQKSNTDIVSVDTGALIRLSRFSDQDCSIVLTLGHKIYNEVSFTNVGNDIPQERTLVVSNVPMQGVLIEETLSDYVNLVRGSEFFAYPIQAIPLVYTTQHVWTEYSAWDGISKVEKVGILLPAANMKPHQSGKFGYTVKVVNQPNYRTVVYTQSILDENSDGTPEFQSNNSCNTIDPPESTVNESIAGVISGIVFDSASLDRIPGAEVLLMDATTHTAVTSTVADSNGQYSFIGVVPGKYYLQVNPPATHVMPSVNQASNFPGRNVSDYSYGLYGYVAPGATGSGSAGVFEVTDSNGLDIDIPLDRLGITGQISIEKTASKSTVSIGDLLSYTIKIRNLTDQELYATYINDRLPYGFRYLEGTARLNGESMEDPSVTPGNTPTGISLAFRLGTMQANAELTLTYITQVTATATGSDGINTAEAQANTLTGLQIHSPISQAQVEIKQEGVLSDRAILFGRIAVEAGCLIGDDKKRQESGWPLADVRLYMEDGTYVITDPDGQFSLYGLQPGLHVLKVDPYTLPEGVILTATDTAHAGDPDSRFVDLIPGDFHRADFTASCPEAVSKTEEKCTEQDVPAGKEWTTRTIRNVIEPLHFDSGKAIIPPEYLEKMRKLVALAKDKHNVRFGFIGHTDNQRLKPSTKKQFKDNQGLSEARAHEAAEYVLKNLGLSTEISVDGKGESEPVASNDNPEGMAKNRRVEIDLIYDEPVEKHAQTTKKVCTTHTVEGENPVAQRILARSKASQQGWRNEVDSLDPGNLNSLHNLARQAEATQDGDISSGLMEAYEQKTKKHQQSFAATKAEEEEKKQEAQIPLAKEAVKTITKAQAKSGTWLWPLTETSLDGRFMVVVRADVTPALYVNGKAVSDQHLGEQIVNKKEQAQIMAWYGVELDEGENHIKVAAKDSFGNERTLAEKTFKRPSAGVAIKMDVDGTLKADNGRSAVPVKIRILDKNGYPAKGTYFLTIEASDGQWLESDIQDKVPGHQVKVTNGERIVHLRSSNQTGQIKVRASTGTLQSETDVAQVADMRPLIAVGMLDIRAHKGYKDGYESVMLEQLSMDDAAKDMEVDGRAALFMKGRVKGDMHLTLSYDNQKDPDAELLRDIDPEAYYQVYGDSSIRGYEAQSRSQLYAKLEKDRHSIMYGDYVTDNNTSSADIAKTQRTLTGVNGIYDDGKTRVQVFAAKQDNPRATEEISGNGTALHYQLQGVPMVKNSEIVEVITRDRANAGLLVNVEQLQRFRDYSIDEVTGNITFHRVIPTLDDELNPVSVRISYDKEEATEDYLVAGIRAEHKITDELTAGISHTRDEHETDGYQVTGAHVEFKDESTSVQAGIARMEHNNGDPDGKAARLQATQRWDDGSRTELTAVQADAGYTNNSGVQADRREIKLTHEQKVSKDITAKVELVDSQALSTESTRRSAEVSATTKVDDWKLKGGVRRIEQSDETTSESINTVLVGAERPVEIFGKKGSVRAEHEREIGDTSRQRTMLGADMQVGDKTKAYVRYENADRLAGGTIAGTVDTQNSLVAGVSTEVLPSTEMYSEYRIDGDISGQDVVAANGAKATLNLDENLVVTPSIEFLNYLEGSDNEGSIAASIGIRDTRSKDSKKLLRLETRHSDSEKYYGVNGTYVTRAGEDMTVMVGDELRYQKYDDDRDDKLQNTLTLAAAHRPKDGGPYNALYAYKWKKATEGDENTHILSTHQHYRLTNDTDVSGHLGAKSQKLTENLTTRKSNAFLAAARVQSDLTEKLGVDAHAGVLATSGDARQYTAGAGIHYNVMDNVRVGAGYNVAGFDENDLDPDGQYSQGGYVGLQVKADEAMFGWLTDEKEPECKTLTTVEREQLYNEGKPLPKGCEEDNNNKATEDEKTASKQP